MLIKNFKQAFWVKYNLKKLFKLQVIFRNDILSLNPFYPGFPVAETENQTNMYVKRRRKNCVF